MTDCSPVVGESRFYGLNQRRGRKACTDGIGIPVKRSVVMAAVMMTVASAALSQTVKEYYGEYEGGPELLGPDDGPGGSKEFRGSTWVGFCATGCQRRTRQPRSA